MRGRAYDGGRTAAWQSTSQGRGVVEAEVLELWKIENMLAHYDAADAIEGLAWAFGWWPVFDQAQCRWRNQALLGAESLTGSGNRWMEKARCTPKSPRCRSAAIINPLNRAPVAPTLWSGHSCH